MFQEKDPLLKPLNENSTPEEMRNTVELLQARLIKTIEKLKAANGKVNSQRKDAEKRKKHSLFAKEELNNCKTQLAL